MKLYFNGKEKDVAIKSMITRRLLTKLDDAFAQLRGSGSNAAMEEAIKKNPKAVQYLGGSWLADIRKEYEDAYQGSDPKVIDGLVQKALVSKLLEEFPEVYEAMANPTTEIDITNTNAVDACFAIAREIVDDRELTDEEKEALTDDEFWEDQDLKEVVATVATFREKVEQGK